MVIATGSSPAYPAAWSDARRAARHERDDVRMERRCRESVAVFGPGVIGLELGQALHRLGVRVKVFGRGGGVGPLSDPELVAEARRVFGAEFYLDTDAHADVARDGDRVAVRYRALDGETRTEHFDYLLAATGRTPNVREPRPRAYVASTRNALRRAGVRPRDDAVRQRRRSSSPATRTATCRCCTRRPTRAGSPATTPRAFPHVHAGMRRAPLSIVFTDPQIAVVGGGWRAVRDVAHVTGARVVRRPGPRARDAAQSRAPARVRGDRHRTASSAPR